MVYRHTERSERVRADSRAKILRAARKLFSRRGYEATTMREVADAAATSIGNLYFYFRNKEELLETLMAEAREPLWAWADSIADSAPPGPARLARPTTPTAWYPQPRVAVLRAPWVTMPISDSTPPGLDKMR